MNYITLTLLGAFVIVFLGTALVTLLGIAGRLSVKDKYLTLFASGLLLEVAGAMVWAFRSQDMSSEAQKFRERFAAVDVANIDPNSKTPEEKLEALLRAKQGLPYRVWTVTGWTDFQDGIGDLNPQNVFVNPLPFIRLDPMGTFSVDVLEQSHGDRGMELPNLVIDQADPNYKYGPEYIVLSANANPTYKFSKHWSEHRITVDEVVKIKKKAKGSGTNAPVAIPISSPPPPPSPSPVLATASPSPAVP
jgi:hypothetical protein